MTALVSLPILVPLFTAAVCLLLWNRQTVQRCLSVVGAVALLCAAALLLATVIRGQIVMRDDEIQADPIGRPVPFIDTGAH